MATTLPLSFDQRLPWPRNGISWAVGVSILLHAAIGWYFISRLLMDQKFDVERPPIEVAYPPVLPPKEKDVELPKVIEDKPEAREKTKPRPRPVVPVAGSATVDSTLLEPASPEISPGPAVPATPAVPAAAPKPTRKVQPVYPDRPLDLEKEGDVVVAIAVGAGGVVTDADIVSEDPQGYGFGKAALAAVRRWEFATATPGTYTVTVKFRLD